MFSDSLSVRTVTAVSVGRGVGFDAAVGVELTEHLFGELALGYLSGLPFESKKNFNSSSSSYSETRTIRGDMLRLSPALVFVGDEGAFRPFVRVGVTMGLPKVTQALDTVDAQVRTIEEVELTGMPTFGIAGALGVEFGLSKGVSLATEVNYLSMAFSPTQGKLVKATENGVDKLPTMTTRQKEVQFVDTLTSNPSVPASAGSPDMETSISIPFSNVGVAVALVYKF